jgi:hypothetical protein
MIYLLGVVTVTGFHMWSWSLIETFFSGLFVAGYLSAGACE